MNLVSATTRTSFIRPITAFRYVCGSDTTRCLVCNGQRCQPTIQVSCCVVVCVQLGQNNILMDKRHVYEWNTRIHLLARGPGIPAGHTWNQPATQVDMAATFTGLAGIPSDPDRFDGKSIVPLLIPDGSAADVPPSTKRHLQEVIPSDDDKLSASSEAYAANWRDNIFIEYYYVEPNDKCVEDCQPLKPNQEYPLADSLCGDLTPGNNSHCWGGAK